MGRQSESGLPVEPVHGHGQPPGFDPADMSTLLDRIPLDRVSA